MNAEATKLLSLLKNAQQFVIPIYQRMYSWNQKECAQLWDDIIRCGKDDNISGHFIGSVVYIEHGLYSVSSQSPLLVIDGQQRITTASLLIAALAEAIDKVVGDDEIIEGFSQPKLKGFYLTNALESGDKKYKLLLSQTDNASLKAIVDGKPQPEQCSIRISENFKYFQSKLKNKEILKTVCMGLSKLIVVDVSLQRGNDNPQLIFESMNSTGKKLSQADLIRNFILMGLESELQTELYNDHWRPMELAFGQKAYSEMFDWYMRHFLTVRTGEIPKVGEVYEAFKQYYNSSKLSVSAIVAEIHQYAVYYCCMALSSEKDKQLKEIFHDIRELRVDVAYPLMLELYNDYHNESLERADFITALQLIESYVFRRAVCAIPTNSLNKTFARMSKSFKKDRYLESVKAALMLLPSYRRFPRDEEFSRELSTRDLYHFRSRSYWLKKIENYKRKERVPVDEYTIEHIMPQCDNDIAKVPLSWQKELGGEWERVWETWRHTLGNLTLTGYNSEYSNKAFSAKRDMDGGFKYSPLKLNEELGSVETWNEDAIKERASKLSGKACKVWPVMSLEADILDAYRPKAEKTSDYSIDDHPYLLKGNNNELFNAFRNAVKALDPCVSEEFLKLYVAFKAETNFVDVVPQAKRLRLSLNMPFSEIDDPRELCKDVTNLGRWGNGDVEVGLESLDELPHVMALVTQAFERQMDDDTE